jgi:curved DNA-binding protein CbpA
MHSIKDYYFILGTSKNASQEEIERAYRKSVLDIRESVLGNGAASVLRDIDEAYSCLRDPVQKAAYDTSQAAFLSPPSLHHGINPGSPTQARETMAIFYSTIDKKKKKRSRTGLTKLFGTIFVLGLIGVLLWSIGHYFPSGKIGRLLKSTAKQKIEETIKDELISMGAAPAIHEPNAQRHSAGASRNDSKGNVKNASTGFVKVYDIRYGGVIVSPGAVCRKEPNSDAKAVANLKKDAIIFVNKESRAGDGTLWYYVESDNGNGWVDEKAVKVYK